MSYEFHTEPKKTNFWKYFLWVVVVFVIAAIFFHFFLTGTKIAYKKIGALIGNSSLANISAIENPAIEKTETDFSVIETIAEEVSLIIEPTRNMVGKSWGEGFTMFRGNPTRTWYGDGLIPNEPAIQWRYPESPMCSKSTDKNTTKTWCGNGWTGQPVVYVHGDTTEIIFGAYDKNVHFVNADTGKDERPPFETGDIIKGSVTLDPDGFPLIYFGSRDNKLRVVSLEQNTPKELWALDSKDLPGMWNDDWDSNPVIVDDVLFTGGENGWFFAIKLNRGTDDSGKTIVNPEVIFTASSYDSDLIDKIGNNVSIENSVAIYKDTVYFANSGGRVMGFSIDAIKQGTAPIIFDYWVGDDVDASIVIDEEGSLYVSVEEERLNERGKEIGQLVKLDPSKDDPLVWNIHVPSKQKGIMGGIWATPALYKNNLYVPTNPGELLVVNKDTGEIVWRDEIGSHAWSSPIVSNDELLVATCRGELRKYDLEEPDIPKLISNFKLPSGSCIESTPVLWNESLYFGSRDGYFYKIGEK